MLLFSPQYISTRGLPYLSNSLLWMRTICPIGKCSFVNSAWCEITGISLQGALGDGWFSAVDPAIRVDVVNAWENSFSSRAQFGPIDFLSNVGVEVRVQAFPLLRYNGELEGYVGVMRRKNTLMS